MMMQRSRWTSQDIAAFLSAGPGERIAFASSTIGPARLAEILSAFANAHGGAVLLGVTSGGKVAGITGPEEARVTAQAAGLLATPPLILPLPQIVEHDGKLLCLVEVPPGLPHVYSLAGRYLTRTGSQNRLLTTAELSGLLLARGEAGFESRPAPGADLDDLDPAQVQAYLDALAAPTAESWQKTLLARGCLTEAADGLLPTYAGILLFGRQPQRFVRHAEIILVRYAGPRMGDEFARHDAAGPLAEQIRQAEAFISANMRRGMRIKGFTRGRNDRISNICRA